MKPYLTLALTAVVLALFGPALRAQDPRAPGSFKVSVQGQVAKPGQYAISPDLTVIDAVELAGGFKPQALRSSVRIAHEGKTTTLDYSDIALNNANANFKLSPGDVIFIPADPTYGK
jgi:protein involved in polysaccharide export with SLBB domain